MRHTTIPIAAGMFAAGVLALAGCATAAEPASVPEDCTPIVEGVETISAGKLTAAVAEYPPYVSLAGGALSGVDGAVLSRVAEELCLVPNGQTQSFTAIIESVKSGSADLSAGNWYINDERKSQFEVSDPVYIDQMAIVSKEGFSTLGELAGSTVGTTQGYLWVADFQAALGTDKVSLYATEDATYQDVKNGRIQAGVFTFGAAQQLLEANNDTTLKIEAFEPDERIGASVDAAQTAVLIQPGNAKLLEAVNAVIAEMREDGSLTAALEENGLDPAAADVE